MRVEQIICKINMEYSKKSIITIDNGAINQTQCCDKRNCSKTSQETTSQQLCNYSKLISHVSTILLH